MKVGFKRCDYFLLPADVRMIVHMLQGQSLYEAEQHADSHLCTVHAHWHVLWRAGRICAKSYMCCTSKMIIRCPHA